MADDKNDDTPGRDPESKSDPAEERSRYFKKLEEWLQEAYAWQSVAAMFPYYMMSGQSVTNPTLGTRGRKYFEIMIMIFRRAIFISTTFLCYI